MADVRKESGQLLADASRSRARTARNSIPASTSSAMRESLSVAALHEKAAIHSGAFDGPMWRATVTQEKKEKEAKCQRSLRLDGRRGRTDDYGMRREPGHGGTLRRNF